MRVHLLLESSMPNSSGPGRLAAVVGGGPAGLMAAEVLSRGGVRVDLYDAMPSVGRKFLLAGVGGMNLTHSESTEPFLDRYGDRRQALEPLLAAFDAEALQRWAHELGVATFVGSSGRVFPTDMKAAPLLRAWLHRLRAQGVRFHTRHRWLGWGEDGNGLRFASPAGERMVQADAVVLALGGGSWPRLGSDGAWQPLLNDRGVALTPLAPSNCGFDVGWSEHFSARFAGEPVKPVAVAHPATGIRRQGEFVVSTAGVEGSLIYALSAPLREQIAAAGSASIELDLIPAKPQQQLAQALAKPRGSRSMAKHLRSCTGIEGVRAGLLRELAPAEAFTAPELLAAAIKALPLRLLAARPLAEAISSAGGVRFEALDESLMLHRLPGVFCAGEMLDWEAPTGGYLLTACFASGRAAGAGALAWLGRH